MSLIKRGESYRLIRSVRRGGRVSSIHVASGPLALELHQAALRAREAGATRAREAREAGRAALDRDRAAAEARRHAAGEARRRDDDLQARLRALAGEAKAVAARAMRASGHHQHRWAWRKTGGVTMDKIEAATAELAATLEAPAAGSSPARAVAAQLIKKWSPDDPVAREWLRREFARVRADLGGPDPSAIERHLAERAAVCWLDTYVSDSLAIQLDGSLNFTPAEKGYFQRTRHLAHRRYVETLKALAMVRARAAAALRPAVAVVVAGGPGPGGP